MILSLQLLGVLAMEIEDITARLIDRVTAFEGRVDSATALAALVKSGKAPNRSPSSYVLPLGLVASPATTMTGLHDQHFTESYGIVIVQTVPNDLHGAKGLPQIHTLRDAVIMALAGWKPSGSWDGLSLTRAKLQSLNAGTITYQVDFSTTDHLRIST